MDPVGQVLWSVFDGEGMPPGFIKPEGFVPEEEFPAHP
jgi:hypothetical protein